MRIFVQSRGYSRDKDYQWHELTVEGEEILLATNPTAYQQFGFADILYDSRESYVLGRFNEKLLLLLSGIASQSRMDFMSRVVRDTIFYEGTDLESRILKGILAKALQNPSWLPTLLDYAITFDEALRFKVNRTIFDSLLDTQGDDKNEPSLTPCIRRLSLKNRQEFGTEIQLTRLPQRQGFLVIVTPLQSLKKMANAGVWRGLTEGENLE